MLTGIIFGYGSFILALPYIGLFLKKMPELHRLPRFSSMVPETL